MKNQIFSVLFIALFILPFQIFAQPEHSGDGPRHKEMMEKLNLTDQQEEQISKLRTDHQMKMIDGRAEIQKLEVQLKDERKKIDLDEEKILSLTKKIGEMRAAQQLARTEMWLKIYNLLDDKQKELWKEHQPERMVKHERMKHKRQMKHQ